jgi:hypothetical protein
MPTNRTCFLAYPFSTGMVYDIIHVVVREHEVVITVKVIWAFNIDKIANGNNDWLNSKSMPNVIALVK